MNAEEKAFDRGLVVGMAGAALALAALIWAASPTEAEKLDHCTDVVWESKNR
tara:strand:+ start:381 stop:536 length:156 start_codon:yes stop_codon:yes gene_type:complete